MPEKSKVTGGQVVTGGHEEEEAGMQGKSRVKGRSSSDRRT